MATTDSTSSPFPLPVEQSTNQIMVRPNAVAYVDPVDADLISFKWYVNRNGRTSYAQRRSHKQTYYMHRIIMSRVLGRDLERQECVDHIDGDGLNNRRSNLRLATYGENQHNQRRNKANTSGYKGVHWNKLKKKWQARIQVNGKRISLGHFDSAEEAHQAYRTAAVEHFGEFARAE